MWKKIGIFFLFLYLLIPAFLLVTYLFQEPIATVRNEVVSITKALSVEVVATGYSLGFPYDSVTKVGKAVIDQGFLKIGDVSFFTIATDPTIIPLGSIVYIEGLGIGYATDTGRLIKGWKIDICFNSLKDAVDWGNRKVQVTLLSVG